MQTPSPMLSDDYSVPIHQVPRPRLKMSQRLYLLSLDLDYSLCLDPLDSDQSIVKKDRTKMRKRRNGEGDFVRPVILALWFIHKLLYFQFRFISYL